jgi:hypothetical protein
LDKDCILKFDFRKNFKELYYPITKLGITREEYIDGDLIGITRKPFSPLFNLEYENCLVFLNSIVIEPANGKDSIFNEEFSFRKILFDNIVKGRI